MKKVDPKILQNLREEYQSETLDLSSVQEHPIRQFDHWMHEAIEAGLPEPNAMTLATVDESGWPDGRVVLLKGFDRDGFVFFTNYDSDKGRQLATNPRAALIFNWLELQRQVRIVGSIEQIAAAESTEYFQSRPRGSQLGAWASPQSSEVADRAELEKRLREMEAKFAGQNPLPRPENWGGFRLSPRKMEFWQGRPNRLHDRILYQWAPESWKRSRLAP